MPNPLPTKKERGVVLLGDNLALMRGIPDESVDLIYMDPPFNTQHTQKRSRIKVSRSNKAAKGTRQGFGGNHYSTETVEESSSFEDSFDDFIAFLSPRLMEAKRLLVSTGSMYLHLDYHEAHYAKVAADHIFGRKNFLNEIIWAYDYGGRPKDRWPPKHDNILVYAKDMPNHLFNREDIQRIPYMAPGLVSSEKAARGKLPTDTWWHTIVGTNSHEKTGYPTQKPLGVLRRIVGASSPKGGIVLDCFAGSGTTGAAALELGRRFVLIDENPEAVRTMQKRFSAEDGIRWSKGIRQIG